MHSPALDRFEREMLGQRTVALAKLNDTHVRAWADVLGDDMAVPLVHVMDYFFRDRPECGADINTVWSGPAKEITCPECWQHWVTYQSSTLSI